MRVETHAPPLFVLVFRKEKSSMPDQKNLFSAYLSVAVFCEKILMENDGGISIIRIFDRFNIGGQAPTMGNQVLRFQILLLFRSGILRGKQLVRIRPHSPTGRDLPALEIPTLFEGDDERGNILRADLNFVVDEEGLFWFDVYLNDQMVTRMPLRVTYRQSATPTTG